MTFSRLLSIILLINCSYVLADAEDRSVKPDPRVRIVSPAPGTIFAPGDRVSVELAADPSLQPDLCDVSVGSSGMGFMDCATQFLRFPVHCSGVIPEEFAGPVMLEALFSKCKSERSEESYSEPYSSEPVTIGVRPKEPPRRLMVINPALLITLPAKEKEHNPITGIYAGGLQRDLSSSMSGTTYSSTDPSVVAVDTEGWLSYLRPGVSVITVENHGVKGFMIVKVFQDKTLWLPPVDVTASFRIEPGEIASNPRQDHPYADFVDYVQEVHVTNISELPVPGHLYLVLVDLPADITLYQQGVTKQIAPLGTPVIEIPLPTTGFSLQPQESVVLHLDFSFRSRSAARQSIRYIPHVFRAQLEP